MMASGTSNSSTSNSHAVLYDDELITKLNTMKYEIVGQVGELLFQKKTLSDMTFVIKNGKDVKRVLAHKFVMSAASWHFHNIFNNLKLDSNDITIEDIKYEAFLIFLEYCYKGKIVLDYGAEMADVYNFIDVLKLAQRYEMTCFVKSLESAIIDCDNIHFATAVEVYNAADVLDDNNKFKQYLIDLILRLFVCIYNMLDYPKLSRESLGRFAADDKLQCDEITLLDALIKWAKNQCERRSLDVTPGNLRNVLGDIFYTIRFPTLSMDGILEVKDKFPGILTQDEYEKITSFIIGKSNTCFEFSTRKRAFIMLNPNSRDIRDWFEFEDTIVPTFSSPFKLGKTITRTMEINITSSRYSHIFGFGVICERKKENNLVQVISKDKVPIGANLHRHSLSWDYEFLYFSFHEKIPLTRGGLWLQCSFTDDVPLFENFKLKDSHDIWKFGFGSPEVPAIPYVFLKNF